MVVTARFHQPGKDLPDEEWREDYTEYMMGRPEVYLWEPPIRIFHIGCTHHVAKAILMAGKVPADFACPLGLPTCPMRKLLDAAPNHSIQLGVNLFCPSNPD
jgi:hypothetical protein